MSILEYRGPGTEHPEEIVLPPEGRRRASELSQSEQDMKLAVKAELSNKATRTYLDSSTAQLVTPDQVALDMTSLEDKSSLGTSLAQLSSGGLIPESLLPAVTTRGARFFNWSGTLTSATSTTSNVNPLLATLNVSNNSTSDYYLVFAWATVETNMTSSTAQVPGLEIVMPTNGLRISEGAGRRGYSDDWNKVDCAPIPESRVYRGNQTLQLRGYRPGTGTASISYSDYRPNFCALTVPVYFEEE